MRKFFFNLKTHIWSLFFKTSRWLPILPSKNDISIKPVVEIIIYMAVFIGLWNLYKSINQIQERNISYYVDLVDGNKSKYKVPIYHNAEILFSLPCSKNDRQRDSSYIPRVSVYFDTKFGVIGDNDSLKAGDISNYYNALNYIQKNYSEERLHSEFSHLYSYHVLKKYKSKFSLLYMKDDSIIGLIDSTKIMQQKERELLQETMNQPLRRNISMGFSNDPDYILRILMIKNVSFHLYHNRIDSLRNIFESEIDKTIGISNLKATVRFPLYYQELKYNAQEPFNKKTNNLDSNAYIYGYDLFGLGINPNCLYKGEFLKKNIDQIVALGCFSAEDKKSSDGTTDRFIKLWNSGLNQRSAPSTIAYIDQKETPVSTPSIFSLFDISQIIYNINIATSEIDSIYLTIDFVEPCDFSKIDPEPDAITLSSITYSDQWKILKIREHGLNFIVKPIYYKNLQSMRLFIIQAIMSALLIAFFTYLIMLILKILAKFKEKNSSYSNRLKTQKVKPYIKKQKRH